MENKNVGIEMYKLAEELFPICRSLTGAGVRETLAILQRELPGMTIHEVPSGSQVFDWTIPKEWVVRQAYIENEAGERVIDYKNLNLHVVGYSTPVDEWVELEELKKHIYVQSGQPDAVPYVTSYYTPRYGFCMSENQRDALTPGQYHMVIDSELFDGHLTYGELIIPGETEKEIAFTLFKRHDFSRNCRSRGLIYESSRVQRMDNLTDEYWIAA